MRKSLIAFIVLLVILIIFTFYPGLKREKTLAVLNSTSWIAKQHIDSKILDQDLLITPVPFGAVVTTYEGMWYITFWGKAL